MVDISIEEFQGPLDLLLSLINQEKIDIMDIPIAHITEQYNKIINSWKVFDLDEASEYILMAARLMQIKSKMLLPRPKREEEEEDPRLELALQLAQYAVYQKIAIFIEKREQERAKSFSKDPEYLPQLSEVELPPEITISGLEKTMRRVLASQKQKRLSSESLEPERFTIEEKKHHLTDLLRDSKKMDFNRCFEISPSVEEIIVTFLAMLELYKMGVLDFEQDGYQITLIGKDNPSSRKRAAD